MTGVPNFPAGLNGLPWRQAPLVAIDLEGSGAQDGVDEAILEIAVVPLRHGEPDLDAAIDTLVNPGRPIPRRPWISPGLTHQALSVAAPLSVHVADLGRRLDGVVMVGHNVEVDYRLLRRHLPGLRPVALLDTLALARRLHPGRSGNALGELLARHDLTDAVSTLVPDGQPHRALWDTVGAALLLTVLASGLPDPEALTFGRLHASAGRPLADESTSSAQQDSLF